MQTTWQVKKRSGELQIYIYKKIVDSIFMAQENIGKENRKQAEKVTKLVIKELKIRFEREKIIGTDEIGDVVERCLIDEKFYDIARAFIISREKKRQEARAEKGLGVIDDIGLPYSSILVIRNKYLRKDKGGKPIETPKKMFQRVANAVAKAESNTKKKEFWRKKFFDLMVNLRFLPGGRTLANAGTVNNQLANCFVIPMPDSVEGIFNSVKDSSILKKNGGGVGFSFSKIRPKGDKVKTTTGEAAGPVAFMKIVNDASDILLQAGGRRSGNMVVLHVTHPDILEFIACKENNEKLEHINLSVGVTDKFMKAVKKDKSFDLINPHTGAIINTVLARSIFEMITSYAWRNGDPGIIFLDRINKDNPTPHVGVLEAVNLCGEQPLLSYEACNLGSINLKAHIKDNDVDWEKLKETVEIGVRMLDDAISIGRYPLRKVTEIVRSNRKIGLGIMGWADMLVKLGFAYNSKEALNLAEKVMGFIREKSYAMSEKLGKEKGSFPNFKGSIWEKKGYKYFRNATLNSIAPTGSIAMVANCSYGIEPHFALAFYKKAMGEIRLPEVNEDLLEKLKNENINIQNGLIDKITSSGNLIGIKEIPEEIKKIFITAHELNPEDHVKMQACFQKYVDNAVSKTINMRVDAQIEDVSNAFMMAWEKGCKGITVYRDSSRSEQVLNIGYGEKKKDIIKPKKTSLLDRVVSKKIGDNKCPQCGETMLKTEGCAVCPSCAFSLCSV